MVESSNQITAGHRPTSEYDTTEIILFHKQLDNGAGVPESKLAIARMQRDAYLAHTKWENKKLLKYHTMEAEDLSDPSIQKIFYMPRNQENINFIYYHNGITGNHVTISNDGTL